MRDYRVYINTTVSNQALSVDIPNESRDYDVEAANLVDMNQIN